MHNEEANNLELSAGNQCSLPEVSVTHSFHLTSPSLSMQTDRHFFQQENKIFEKEQECDSHLLLGGLAKVLDRCMPTKGQDGLLSRSYIL